MRHGSSIILNSRVNSTRFLMIVVPVTMDQNAVESSTDDDNIAVKRVLGSSRCGKRLLLEYNMSG